MEQRKIRSILQFMTLMCAAALFAATPLTARAQDFYGEGNVLIAVDMGPYAENEDVSYPEGTMGELIWGADAPTGVSTRAPFNNKKYNPGDVTPVKAPDYETEVTYTVGQKVIFPIIRDDDPDCLYTDSPGYNEQDTFFFADDLPAEIFSDEYSRVLIAKDNSGTDEDGNTYYQMNYEKTEDGSIHPCADFLGIECVAVTRYSTIWQYTGNAYSTRTGFDIQEYENAIDLTEEKIRFFTDICDKAYEEESKVYGDPHWEDMRGDRDKKAAYLVIGFDGGVFDAGNSGFYNKFYTTENGFDCLLINNKAVPGGNNEQSYTESANYIRSVLIHEFNHYIVSGYIGNGWNIEMGEAFAETAVYITDPANSLHIKYEMVITEESSRLQTIMGLLCSYDSSYHYMHNKDTLYALCPHFLRYIERETTGKTDGRLWTEYLAGQTPGGSITPREISAFLEEKTGESLYDWLAQFMAAIVVSDDSGLYSMGDEYFSSVFHVDPDFFFRSYEEYGKNPGFFDGDNAFVRRYINDNQLSAVQGGGTTYAFRNDAGGRIAITGADERWYFFAVNMDLSPKEVIEIADAKELAKIGNDPGYPLHGSYILTADIDLGGELNPWTPIGSANPFTGELNGNGHTISGLYINTNHSVQGLFSFISGNSVIRDLTVRGEITGNENIGGIVGKNSGATISGCTSFMTVNGTLCVGGIVGYEAYGNILNCTAAGIINGTDTCGGIIGQDVLSVTENCHNLADVSGDLYIGGISGYCDNSTINHCENTGYISGDQGLGGITGAITNGTTVSNCRSTGAVSGNRETGGITGISYYGILENNQHNSPYEAGSSYQEDNGSIIFTEISSDGKPVVSEYKINSGTQTVSLKKLDSTAREINVQYTLPGSEDLFMIYTVTSIAKGAFKNTRNASIFIPETVDTLRANTFNGTALRELIFIVRNASDLKIKKGAFNNIKKPRKTTIRILTTDKEEFDKIVKNFKKAGGDKFKYEFKQL